jgi:hypothetical protein
MFKRISALAWLLAMAPGPAAADNVVTYHNSPTRHGAYIVANLTLGAAASMHLDRKFSGNVDGHVYGQPLFWHPAGRKPLMIVATESNVVAALDAVSGATVWKNTLGTPVPLKTLPCGDIDPVGITGTPVIDPAAGILYLDALILTSTGPKHFVYALSLANGSVISGWPLDVGAGLESLGVSFSSATQGERSALQLMAGTLYVNFGGNWGDCGTYHGTVIQVQISPPKITASWQTRANGGGIWAQGGLASDGGSLFATTGNTFNASKWGDGEAIIRLKPGLVYAADPRDFFTPSDWRTLDNEDKDLGGTEALPLDIAVGGSQPVRRVIALGKDGNAYLVDRSHLGGIGGALAVKSVSNNAIITAPAVYQTQSASMVAFTNSGGGICSSNGIMMLGIAASGPSPITELWCASFNGGGAPIITTTDGSFNPIVWVVGAEGDNLLHGFNALNGNVVFGGGNTPMAGLHHFVTVLAAEGRFYIGADNRIFAFTFAKP